MLLALLAQAMRFCSIALLIRLLGLSREVVVLVLLLVREIPQAIVLSL